MFCRQDQVGRKRDLEAAAAADAVDGCYDRLVEVAQLLHATEAADAIVAIDRVAISRRLQVPSRTEEFFARAGDDRNPERIVVAEVAEDLAHDTAGFQVDGIGLRPVDRDFEDAAFAAREDRSGHEGQFLRRMRASAATAPWPFGNTINGLISSSSSFEAFATT